MGNKYFPHIILFQLIMDQNIYGSTNSEEEKNSQFTKEEITSTIVKMEKFITICFRLMPCRILVNFLETSSFSFLKLESSLYILFLYIQLLVIYFLVIPRVKKFTNEAPHSTQSIKRGKKITDIISTILIISDCFGNIIFEVSTVSDDFVRGLTIMIFSNILLHHNLLFVRNPRLSLFIHFTFVLFSFFILRRQTLDWVIFLKLLVPIIFSMHITNEVFKERKQKIYSYIDIINDRNNLFKIFLTNLPDPVIIKSMYEGVFYFINNAILNLRFSEKYYTISGLTLYNKEHQSLSERVYKLLHSDIGNCQSSPSFCEDFTFEKNLETKLYSIMAVKVNQDNKEYLGIYIKDISKTAETISKNTAAKVFNRQICNISHELKTPIHQSLAILMSFKKLIIKEKLKIKISLLKSSLYRLALKVDEFLEYAKNIEGNLKLECSSVRPYDILKEIMIVNYECIRTETPIFEFNIYNEKNYQNIIIDRRKILIILQSLLDSIIEQKMSLKLSISINMKTKYTIFKIICYLKEGSSYIDSPKKQESNFFFDFNFNEAAEERRNLSKDLVPLLCNLFNCNIISNKYVNSKLEYELKIPLLDEPNNLNINEIALLPEANENEEDENFGNIQEFSLLLLKRNLIREFSPIIPLKKLVNFGKKQRSRSANFENLIKFVIVADDNQLNRFALSEILKSLGAKIAEAENGSVAVNKFLEAKKDLIDHMIIFMDLDMPVMDGITACIEIRKIEKEHGWNPIAIIAVTAFDSEIEKAKALRSGMNAFYTKPLKRAQLNEILKAFFGKESILS